MKKLLLLILWLPQIALSNENTSSTNNPSLAHEITVMDSLLFDEAFNKCNFAVFKTIISTDIEFYDDRSGLNDDIDKEYAAFKDKCSRPFSVTRKLIQHTVHELGDYGAVQKGTHIFLNDGDVVQSAKFITIWEKTDKSWVVKRAISYEHKDM